MIDYPKALACWFEAISVGGEELVPVGESGGRRVARDIFSDVRVPPFDTSAMDGWVFGRRDLPPGGGELPVAARIAAGSGGPVPIPSGSAVKVMTGAPLPEAAEGVLPVEEAEDRGSTAFLSRVPARGENVRLAGELLSAGARLATAGESITPRLLALLASAAAGSLPVRRRPVAALLATGDELVPAGSTLRHGEIRNSNGPFLEAALLREGARVLAPHSCSDRIEDLGRWLLEHSGTASGADILLTTGGVSMGDRDLLARTLESIGARILFHRVAIRPGRPLLAARREGTVILALPGNPVSVSVGWELFGKPALRRMTGRPEPAPRFARLLAPARNPGQEESFSDARLSWEGADLLVTPLLSKGSHDLVSHAAANALLRIPSGVELSAGELAEVLPLDRSE